MKGGKTRRRVLSVLLGAGIVALLALLAACGSGGGAGYQLDGVVQAVDGQQVVLTLDDGSKVRLDTEKQADDARKMIGEEVKCKVKAGEDRPKLIDIEKVGAPTTMPGLQVMAEDFHFSGVVESTGIDAIVIGGKTFKVNAATILDQGLVTGVVAEAQFIMLSDGGLMATEVSTKAPDEAAASQAQPGEGVAEDYTLTGVIGSITANELMLGGKTFEIDAVTVLDQGLKPGVMARVEFVIQADGSLLALQVETDAPEVTEAKQEDYTANGPIQAMDMYSVTVDGRKFMIDGTTRLDKGLAQGVLVEIEFVIKPDGSMLATQVETSGIDEGTNLYFAGPIQSMSPTAWVIGGKTFAVNAVTQLDQGLGVGINANVEFVTRPDGSFLSVHIENTGFKFIGMVQAIAPNAYTIGGRVFTTNANTLVDQGLKVRKLVQVSFLIQPDGSLLALQIKIPKTKVTGFTFKGVVQSLTATSMVATGQAFDVIPTTVLGVGVATGVEVNVVFDIKPGNILSAISVQNAKAAQK